MGYSLSTPCKSAKARDEMEAFLDEHLRPFSEVIAEDKAALDKIRKLSLFPSSFKPDWDPTAYLAVGDGLAYGAGANKIGFNFSTSHNYGQWMYGLCRFMALRVGRKRTFKGLLGVEGTFPYYTYDFEGTPVLTEEDYDRVSESAKGRFSPTDHVGFTHPQPWGDSDAATRYYRSDVAIGKVVKRELARLAVLWDDRNN